MIVDNESDKNNTLCIALLYRYRTHTFAQIFIECSRINYVSKSNCKNPMLFVRVTFVSAISISWLQVAQFLHQAHIVTRQLETYLN